MAVRGDGLRLEVAPSEFKALVKQVKDFDPKLATNLRREMRAAGKDAIADMRSALGSGPLGQRIGKGIVTKVETGKNRQGVKIESTGRGLPDPGFARVYNKPSFRHPVFGNRDVWVQQDGRPYFGRTLRQHESKVRDRVQDALNKAVAAMGGGPA